MQIVTENTIFQMHTVVALGTFDGLHHAHCRIIERAKEIAHQKGLCSMVYTFSNLPSAHFGGEQYMLFTEKEKIQNFAKMGIDYLCIQPFDGSIAHQSREAFMEEVLNRLHAKVLVAGYNFRFGDGAAGDVAFLQQYASAHGAEAAIIDRVDLEGDAVSSTRIRAAVRAGKMELAEHLLGYPYAITGEIVHGREVGRTLGFPTANIYAPKEKVMPPNGVYIARVWLEGKAFGGITNIGRRPTLQNGEDISIETNILQLDAELYGKTIRVELLRFLRPEQPFHNLQALQQAIARDKEQARLFFEKMS